MFRRGFSTAAALRLNIGRQPVKLAEGVEVYTESIPHEFLRRLSKGSKMINLNRNLVVKGPKGILRQIIPDFVQIDKKDGDVVVLVPNPKDKLERLMWGTARALVQNNVIGVTEGHLSVVKFVGTGYRATIEGDEIAVKVGFPYIPRVKIPAGVKVTLPNPTSLIMEGTDKREVTQLAAKVRAYKPPEPYKGKGIFVDGETIKLKEKKIK